MEGIRFEGVSKHYGSVTALDRLSFEMPAGRLTGFVGPNGAGKSTSFRSALGLTRINGGTITILGMTVGPDTAAIVKRVGAIVEDPGHHRALTGRANLRVAAATLGRGEEEIDGLLRQVGLADSADRKVAGYSKGMRQRLGLAAALMGDPDVLVLDEPLDGLDPAGQVSFKDQLRALVDDHGKTVVVSSHDLTDIEQLADHIVLINHGSLVAQGPTESLMTGEPVVHVTIDDPDRARSVLESAQLEVSREDGQLVVGTDDAARVGELLANHQMYPTALTVAAPSLEEMFLELTKGDEA